MYKPVLTLILICFVIHPTIMGQQRTIKPGEKYKQYWQYEGKPIMLLGGSEEDNLFQIGNLEEHLDLLVLVGGNYVRNTMSSRDEGNVWPFAKKEDGKYDLNQWNPAYWNRFEKMLQLTSERDIIVQVEVWATFDFYRDNWDVNPFNPVNNDNINLKRSKLSTKVSTHPVYTENNFFRSVPSQMALTEVLWYQQKFVDKMLSYSLDYGNVLYCMDNETSVTSDWGKFWAKYIKKKAREQGKTVYCTEMWDPWELSHPMHNETFDHPEIYDFVDISQNNHITGQEHWDNGLKQIQRLKQIQALRPVTNIKVYGNDGGKHKTTRNAIESFIQNVFMGCASTRFHRPTSGQGLNENAQAVIKSMRQLSEKMYFFEGAPHNELLANREKHEAYCRAIPGKEYAVYFPDGGEVTLFAELENGMVQWLNVLTNEWTNPIMVSGIGIHLETPEKGHWVVLVQEEGEVNKDTSGL
jgi:hypothetical protein